MRAEQAPSSVTSRPSPILPLELRAALETIAAGCGSGSIGARVVGQPRLTSELSRYAPVESGSAQALVALGVEPRDLRDLLREQHPLKVLTLVAGPLAAPLYAARSSDVELVHDLPMRAWRSLGYERRGTLGFQGLGAIGLAVAERLAHRARRPDLADRCRIAMQRSVRPSCVGWLQSTIRVREYRSVR